ncbi:serine hydrolase, partial [Pseudomonas stutzeri]|nr:serine hydrolase [Stutzerimonas stutzeri]
MCQFFTLGQAGGIEHAAPPLWKHPATDAAADGAGDLLFWPTTSYSNAEVVERLGRVPLKGGFRESYAYDNILYAVAQQVIEHVSGMSYQ